MAKRSLRPRPPSQYANQQEWDVEPTAEDDFILARRYNALEKFKEYQNKGDSDLVREMKGKDFTLQYVQEHGLTTPLVFRDKDGLGMKLPPADFAVSDVKRLVGPRRQVDVVDTLTQQATTMTMHQWAKYYQTQPRKRLLNVISLEFSCTKMADFVEPPTVVRQLDWVEGVWPREMKEAQTDPTNDMRRMMYPKVQKYCLMSVAGCYTDFHLDFGGTSVWYHLIRGEKLFLIIPPSQEAYDMFQLWQLSGEQEGVFFADLTEHAQLIRLTAGDTFIMPSGWLHAVYTPSDSLVFGGNFLHSFNIPQQLAVADMEAKTKVPSKFRYPFYGTIHWYALLKYSKELKRIGITPDMEEDHCDSHSSSLSESLSSKTTSRWLKEVSVEKVLMPSQESSPSTESASVVSTPHTPSHLHQPHISTIETEGLLVLLKRMKTDALFMPDAPLCLIDPPTDLLSQLSSQLKSPSLERHCRAQPTGVSLLHRDSQGKRDVRKRQLKHLKIPTPEKVQKRDKQSPKERLSEKLSEGTCSPGVLKCNLSEDSRGLSSGLESPLNSSFDFDIESPLSTALETDGTDDPASPSQSSSPFCLQLPCTPSLAQPPTFTPSQSEHPPTSTPSQSEHPPTSTLSQSPHTPSQTPSLDLNIESPCDFVPCPQLALTPMALLPTEEHSIVKMINPGSQCASTEL